MANDQIPSVPSPDDDDKKQDPVAAAMEETLRQFTVDALLNAKPEDLVGATGKTEIRKGSERPSSC